MQITPILILFSFFFSAYYPNTILKGLKLSALSNLLQ